MSSAETKTGGKKHDLSEVLDMNTFEQILEMDEPDDNEFSSSIVLGFLDQAEETFTSMDQALEAEQLDELSALGHFLKGSSATLGLVKIRDGCENIQRYGKKENVDGSPLPDADECLKLIRETLEQVKKDYKHATVVLREHYPGDAA
ncbi:hpt domain-containing protein [Sarocladium implicatum]|nr:hpt domain-containing protein [Sarocladium implicatum]